MGSENNNKEDLHKVPFETALDKAGFGLYSWLLTALTGLIIIACACIIYSSTIVVPTSACELETTTWQQGLLVAAPVVAGVIGIVIWGYLADTRGRRRTLLISFCAATIINSLATLSVNWIMLLILQFLASIMAAGQYSIAMTLLSECVPMAKRNVVVLIVASIFMLSQGVMALFAIPIMPLKFSIYISALGIYWNPWRTTLLIYGVPSIICFVCLWFMEESPKFVFMKKGEEEALKILRKIHRFNNRRSLDELQVKGLQPELSAEEPNQKKRSKGQMRSLFKGKFLKYFIIMTTLTVFKQNGAFMIWLPTIADQFVKMVETGDASGLTMCDLIMQGNAQTPDAIDTCALNETSLLLVFSIAVLQSLLNVVLSMFVNKIGRRNAVIAISSVCGVSGILVNLMPNAIGSAVFFLIFLMSMLLLGLYTAICVALFPTALRALAVSLTMAGGRIMLFASAQIFNVLINNNCALGFYIFTSLVAASAVVAFFLPDDRYLPKTDSTLQLEPSKEITDELESSKYLNLSVDKISLG